MISRKPYLLCNTWSKIQKFYAKKKPFRTKNAVSIGRTNTKTTSLEDWGFKMKAFPTEIQRDFFSLQQQQQFFCNKTIQSRWIIFFRDDFEIFWAKKDAKYENTLTFSNLLIRKNWRLSRSTVKHWFSIYFLQFTRNKIAHRSIKLALQNKLRTKREKNSPNRFRCFPSPDFSFFQSVKQTLFSHFF